MATSRSPTPPSTKRLVQELKSIVEEPSPVLQSLRPASEADILHWEAVLKGVPGTAYEGNSSPSLPLPPLKNQTEPNFLQSPY